MTVFIRRPTTARAAAAAVALLLLLVAGAALGAARQRVIAVYRGHTSQHAPISVRYAHTGATGYVTVRTTVTGTCRRRRGGRARRTIRLSVQGHGPLPIPSPWNFTEVRARFRIAVSGATSDGGRHLAGRIDASWRTGSRSVPRCRAEVSFHTAQ